MKKHINCIAACLVAMLVILPYAYVAADAREVDVIEMNVGTGTDSGIMEMDDDVSDGEEAVAVDTAEIQDAADSAPEEISEVKKSVWMDETEVVDIADDEDVLAGDAWADPVVEDASMASIFTAGNKSKAKPAKARITSLKKSAVNGVNTVTIEWNRAKNATHYRIYYKEAGSGSWKLLKTFGKAKTKGTISSTDAKPLADGKTYLFTVRSYNNISKKWGLWDKTGSKVMFLDKNTVKVKLVEIFDPANRDVMSGTYGLRKGSIKLETMIYPSNATDKSLRWTSSNPSVATVSSNGVITMKAGGKTEIRAYANGGDAQCYFKVTVIDEAQVAQEVIELTNQERIKAGKEPLKICAKLNEFAMIRAKELSIKYSHDRPNGLLTPNFGENIGYCGKGLNSAQIMVQAWMNSLGHRVAIMGHTYFGVGVYIDEERVFFVQNFSDTDIDQIFTIILDCNGGSGPDSFATFPMQCLSQKDLPVPQKPGFIFKGWALYKRTIFKSMIVSNDNIELTAMWEPI